MYKCPNCGGDLPEHSKFCPNCGMKVDPSDLTEQSEFLSSPPQDVENEELKPQQIEREGAAPGSVKAELIFTSDTVSDTKGSVPLAQSGVDDRDQDGHQKLKKSRLGMWLAIFISLGFAFLVALAALSFFFFKGDNGDLTSEYQKLKSGQFGGGQVMTSTASFGVGGNHYSFDTKTFKQVSPRGAGSFIMGTYSNGSRLVSDKNGNISLLDKKGRVLASDMSSKHGLLYDPNHGYYYGIDFRLSNALVKKISDREKDSFTLISPDYYTVPEGTGLSIRRVSNGEQVTLLKGVSSIGKTGQKIYSAYNISDKTITIYNKHFQKIDSLGDSLFSTDEMLVGTDEKGYITETRNSDYEITGYKYYKYTEKVGKSLIKVDGDKDITQIAFAGDYAILINSTYDEAYVYDQNGKFIEKEPLHIKVTAPDYSSPRDNETTEGVEDQISIDSSDPEAVSPSSSITVSVQVDYTLDSQEAGNLVLFIDYEDVKTEKIRKGDNKITLTATVDASLYEDGDYIDLEVTLKGEDGKALDYDFDEVDVSGSAPAQGDQLVFSPF